MAKFKTAVGVAWRQVLGLAVLGWAVTLGACGSDDSTGDAPASVPRLSAAARTELLDKGVGKYLDKAKPTSSKVDGADARVTHYEFAPEDGPVCLWGDKYAASVRDTGSDNLVIFLQGGGACWTGFCFATEKASGTLPRSGLLDDRAATNVVADWNVVYAPYCDGSVFSGDNELTVSDGRVRHHRGLANLSAAVTLAKQRFPNPKRILLAGSSAGGYGTLVGTAVVRLAYPDADLLVFNDAGLGLTNPDNPTMWETITKEWQFTQFIPDSCTDCSRHQMTALIAWGLKNDPSLKAAAFSALEDGVIGSAFLQMEGSAFKNLVLAETTPIHEAYPDRFERFFVEGIVHTTLMADQSTPQAHGYLTPEDGVSVSDWTRAFVEGTAQWSDRPGPQ